MTAPELVYQVDSVRLAILKSNPPQLQIDAEGLTRTGGWTNPELVEIVYVQPPADGIYDYDFVAEPPSGPSTDALTPIAATTIRTSIPDDLKGVRVRSETNSVEQPL
jgi:hypothetical protein